MSQADDLYTALMKAQILLEDGTNLLLQKYNLSVTRYYALVHLNEHPGLSQNELSERLLCTKGNTTRIVKGLENDGYITREVDQEDNRALKLHLTAAGQELVARASLAYHEFNELRFSHLTSTERDALQQNLGRLNNILEPMLHPQNQETAE